VASSWSRSFAGLPQSRAPRNSGPFSFIGSICKPAERNHFGARPKYSGWNGDPNDPIAFATASGTGGVDGSPLWARRDPPEALGPSPFTFPTYLDESIDLNHCSMRLGVR